MSKRVSTTDEPLEQAARILTPQTGPLVPPAGPDDGFAGPHLTALSEPFGGFQEPPAPPFSAMPETMPPPPIRPALPPDLRTEPEKPGLIARLLGRGTR